MRSSARLLKRVAVPKLQEVKASFQIPALSTISASQLPNNSFETSGKYFIQKSAFQHWPVYKKVQNTRISTEIKRVEGNVSLFAEELFQVLDDPRLKADQIKVNTLTGEVNIKGDYVDKIKDILDRDVKYV